MIQLTDQLHNVVYVNPQHIIAMQVCGINERCDLTSVNYESRKETYRTGFIREIYIGLSEHELGVKIHFVTGETIIVCECLAKIKELIKENFSLPQD